MLSELSSYVRICQIRELAIILLDNLFVLEHRQQRIMQKLEVLKVLRISSTN